VKQLIRDFIFWKLARKFNVQFQTSSEECTKRLTNILGESNLEFLTDNLMLLQFEPLC